MCRMPSENLSREWESTPVTRVFEEGGGKKASRPLLREHELDVFVDGEKKYSLCCTRGNLPELVLGRLYVDGVIEDQSDVKELIFTEEESKAIVKLSEEARGRLEDNKEREEREEKETGERREAEETKETETEQGKTKGREERGKRVLRPEDIFSLSKAFLEHEGLYGVVGSVHKCLLSCPGEEGEKLFFFEDIGRHHAVDKAIGFALLENIPLKECVLFTSGRVPLDMVRKAARAGIYALISKSLPTMEAVREAKRVGLLLICRAWPDSYEIYAGEEA